MSYTVLARRYRSRDFDEVVGQQVVADTLKRAVETDHVGHAYLFCGTRGVGKTTMARIFARALNVPREDSSKLTDADDIAEAIMRGDDLDVIEIDGASNRGVQEARDLIAAAGLSPARCPFRIYIIDEVHMLTTESFNTLLKTMEEPPSHVKFILCTTEPHKVLPTIQSRCQRFDFRPIPLGLIVEHLGSILGQEGVEAEDGVLHRVAELGNGSMRDALSVLDRLLAGGDRSLSVVDTERLLGLPEVSLVDAVIEAIGNGDAGSALLAADHLLRTGTSLDQALESLTERFRRMLVLRSCGPDSDVLDLAPEDRAALASRAGAFDAPTLVHAMAACEAAARQARMGASARAVFDATIARLALASELVDPARLPEPVLDAPATKKKRSGVSEKTVAARPPKPKPKSKPDPIDAPVDQPAAPSPPPVEVAPGPMTVEAIWSQVEQAAASNAARAALEGVVPVSMDDGELIVRAVDGGIPGLVIERLGEQVSSVMGRRMLVRVEGMASGQDAPPSTGPQKVDDPRVDIARDLFDAEIVDVQAGTGKGRAKGAEHA